MDVACTTVVLLLKSTMNEPVVVVVAVRVVVVLTMAVTGDRDGLTLGTSVGVRLGDAVGWPVVVIELGE